MNTIYVGNTLVNDIFLGSTRMNDVIAGKNNYQIEYLVVAGGGGGGDMSGTLLPSAGGGGAGGLLSGSLTLKKETVYQVKVGAGGPLSTNGEDSYFTGSFTGSGIYLYSFGGGAGGFQSVGSNGGSGGGGSNDGGTSKNGGTGVSGQGTNGQASVTFNRGGDGGGLNVSSSISGTAKLYAFWGYGGSGIPGAVNLEAPANSGFGGNGAGNPNGGCTTCVGRAGGSGVVIIRYLGAQRGIGGTVSTDGNYTVHQFTSSGNFTFYSN